MAYPIELSGCYLPVGKPESEMTGEEKKLMEKFETMKLCNRISDRLRWDTELLKMKIRIYEDFIK